MRPILRLLPLLGLLAACSDSSRLNVLLVSLDTTRADRLGCYGYSEPSSPVIDQLAGEGTLFTEAFATNPTTLPSHTSIMTGTYPLFHGVRDNSTFIVQEEAITLAEVLRNEGYTTAAMVGAFVLDSRFNLDQGFDHYDDRVAEGWSKDEMERRAANAFGFAERKANLVTRAALEWLQEPRDQPFFLWLHYFDPHQPVNPPDPHHSRFSEPYVGEIAFADEQLGQVLRQLEQQGEYENTLIVVTADHGEGLMEHGEPTHALLVFDSTLRVPLVVRMPGAPAGRRVDQLVSTVDIMPTILDLLGVDSPVEVQGESFAEAVKGGAPQEGRAIYMESMVSTLQCGWGPLRALRTPTEKLIHGPKPRLYRVDQDPGEVYNLASQEPEAVERLTRELARRMEGWTAPEAERSLAPADEETLRKLAALGYLGRSSGSLRGISDSLTDVAGLEDPHELRRLFDLIGVATENIRTGLELEGIRQLEEVLTRDPNNPAALNALAKAYLVKANQPERAREYFERSLAVDPQQEEVRHYMARLLRAYGDLAGAQQHAEKILEFQPRSLGALYELGGIYETQGKPERAREHYLLALELDPANVGVLLALGTSHARYKENDEAGPYFKRALDLEPGNPQVLYNSGIWYLQRGEVDEAITSLSKAVAVSPSDPSANYVLGKLLFERGDEDRARRLLTRARGLTQSEDRLTAIEGMLAELAAE